MRSNLALLTNWLCISFMGLNCDLDLLKVCVVRSTCQCINENSQLYIQFLGLKFFFKNDYCIDWLQASEETRLRIFLVLCRISKSILVSRKREFDQTFYTAAKIAGGQNKTSTKLRSDKCPVRQLTASLSHLKVKRTGISRRRYSGLQEHKLKIDDLVKWLPIAITLYVIECMIILNTTAKIVRNSGLLIKRNSALYSLTDTINLKGKCLNFSLKNWWIRQKICPNQYQAQYKRY